MKKGILFLVAVFFNCIMGAMVAQVVDVDMAIGAISANILSFSAGAFIPTGVLSEGVLREVWTGEMVKGFRNALENVAWLGKIRSYDQYVNNDVIHFVQLGGDPNVLVNNSAYPIGITTIEDADKAISLDKFQTERTIVTDDEIFAMSYDKLGSVIERHKEAILETLYKKAAHSIAPVSHTTQTPVLLSTGEVSEDGLRKQITRKDIIRLKDAFDKMKVPTIGRILVLCSDHINDLISQDQKFESQYYNYTTGKVMNLYGFEVYEYNQTPYYKASTKTKLAYDKEPTAEDTQASFAFHTSRVMRATGSLSFYSSLAKDNPDTQANEVNFRQYFVALPLKEDALGAIVSAKGNVTPEASLTISTKAISFPKSGSTKSVSVKASCDFTVTPGNDNAGFSHTVEGNVIKLTAEANTGAERTGSYTVTLDGHASISEVLTITQSAGN